MERDANIETRLCDAGIKPTSQRIEIGGIILRAPQHLSAEQILAELQNSGSRVSKATVYNTLKLFTDRGLINEVSVDPSRQFYDSRTDHHHHFYNADTGELRDIESGDLEFSRLPTPPAGADTDAAEVIVRVRNKR